MAWKRKKRDLGSTEASTDLTPMIDVVFQLIIFFIVTVQLDRQTINKEIKLPDAPHGKLQERRDPEQVTVQVDSKGNFFIGRQKYNLPRLKLLLKNTVRTSGGANFPILIRGDLNSEHLYIRQAMDACAEVGLYQIRIAGNTENQG